MTFLGLSNFTESKLRTAKTERAECVEAEILKETHQRQQLVGGPASCLTQKNI